MNHLRKTVISISALSILLASQAGLGGGSSRAAAHGEGEMGHALSAHEHAAGGVPLGLWGGEHARLQLTERGGEAEFDCAHATLDRRITTDRRGRFSVAGTYFEERGGPARPGEQTGGYAVRFTGRVAGRTMKLTVTRRGSQEIIGTFNLVHNREPFLVKCL